MLGGVALRTSMTVTNVDGAQVFVNVMSTLIDFFCVNYTLITRMGERCFQSFI